MVRLSILTTLLRVPRMATGRESGLFAHRHKPRGILPHSGRLGAWLLACPLLLAGASWPSGASAADPVEGSQGPVYEVRPIGWVRKQDGRTTIEIEPRYAPALYRLDELNEIWVLYWFDRNDTPEQRSILQVHPRGNPANPLRGVFATRAPVRPNLIALSRCRVLSVQGTTIEIDDIDAFADTPVLDIKP